MQQAKGNIRTIATAQDPTLVRCFRGHEKTINSIVFSSDMKQIASASVDGLVQVWSFKPQVRPFKFTGHIGAVNDVIFNKDNTKIISCGQDREIRFWKNSVQGKHTSIKAHSGPILKLSMADTFLLSCSSDKSIKMWSLDGKFKQSYLSHTNWVRQCQIAPDQRIMLSCSDDRTVKIWDLQQSKVVNTYSDHKSSVLSCKFSPDGTCIAGSSLDGSIKLWDTRSNKMIQHYNAHNQAINRIAFHPYGYHLSSVSDEGKIKIWDLKQGRLGWTLLGHTGEIKAIEFCQKGDFFATGAQDSLVMVWRSNFDEGLTIPARLKESNYIEKQGNSLQPLFVSNKVIKNENIHKKPVLQKQVEGSQNKNESIKDHSGGLLETMSSGLQKLVNQLDFATKIIASLDERIIRHEKTIQSMFEHPKIADYLAILEDSDKLRPETYNSVWEAFKNEEKNKNKPNSQFQINNIAVEDLDFDPMSNKKISQEEILNQAKIQEQFKQKLEEEVEFLPEELVKGEQLQLNDQQFS